jgi:hypothetical protein
MAPLCLAEQSTVKRVTAGPHTLSSATSATRAQRLSSFILAFTSLLRRQPNGDVKCRTDAIAAGDLRQTTPGDASSSNAAPASEKRDVRSWSSGPALIGH